MKALVVNCSAPRYNLGALKLADWLRSQGYEVAQRGGTDFRAVPLLFFGYDLVALSVIFSWDAPIARDIAIAVRANSEVWCGGPGMSDLVRQPTDKPDQLRWWQRETGLPGHHGLDARFDKQRGDYLMTFAARGCDVGCWFCNVWRIEGKTYSLDRGFRPAAVLCDNNLSGMPVEYQEFIIARYLESGVQLRDANSGFEPRSFDEGTLARWDPLLKPSDAPFRFAFDEQEERADVERTCRVLAGLRSRRKQVWILAGNEPIASCYDRAMSVLAWGAEPWCQFVLPLTWLGDPATLRPRHDWTYQLGRDFCRYFNRRLWRSISIAEYRPRQNGPRPFLHIGAGNSAQTPDENTALVGDNTGSEARI